MKNIPMTLALRYLFSKSQNKNISFMIKLCFLGILIGSFSLMLTLIITNGFEKTIHEKMQGTNAQVIISAPGYKMDYEPITTALQQQFPNYISGISASITKQALLDKNKSQSVIFLKGIDPYKEHTVTNIPQKLIQKITAPDNTSSAPLLAQLLNTNGLIIGHKTAENYKLKVGDTIDLLIPEPRSKKRIILEKHKAVITGIFNIGLEEYDNNLAFSSIDFIQELFDIKGVDTISLKINDPSQQNFTNLWKYHQQSLSLRFLRDASKLLFFKVKQLFMRRDYEQSIIQAIKQTFPHLTVYSWKDLYPALVSSLKLEKYVTFFILALITLVASMNMVSLLSMHIQQKRRDIAILKTMGLAHNKIQKIFLIVGLLITSSAATLGLLLAGIAGYFLETYPFIELPDVYYVSHLPARMDIEIFLVVFAATMLLGFLATWIPSRQVKRINITQVLKQE